MSAPVPLARPDGRPLSRALHDARGGLCALSDAADILAHALTGPPESLRAVVDLCDRDGWLQARRRAMRERLDALDVEMDRALAVARERIRAADIAARGMCVCPVCYGADPDEGCQGCGGTREVPL